MGISLNKDQDKFVWGLTSSGKFTIKSMYGDMLNGHARYLHKYLWKLKIPLKIKIFMWFLSKKILLTGDNLAKRNWNGNKKCCFCDAEESVEHLFISCHFARLVWRVVFAAYNIPPPSNITNMFGNLLNGTDKTDKARIRIGVLALCWLIRNCRNDIVFKKKDSTNFLQVIHTMVHWIQLWRFLLPEDQRECMVSGCNRFRTVA
jgi:hypothetical protein